VTDLATLRRYTRARMGVPASDDFFTDAVVNDAINLAVNIVEEEHYWPWAERVTPGTITAGIVTKPTRWRATRALFAATTGDELTMVSINDLYASTRPTGGAPQAWADNGTDIVVSPIPADGYAVTHIYYVSPAELALDTDIPDLPSSMADAVVSKAAELMSAREDDQTARAAHGNDYAKWVQRMLRSQRRSTGPMKVRVRPGGWV
jgi:hypothetical protein